MKYLKYIIFLLTLFFSLTTFIGCETQEIYNSENKNIPKISYISFKEFSTKRAVKEKFNQIEQNNRLNSASKLIYSAEYNFLIDTNQILFYQYDDYKAYTFKIYKANEIEKLENLVIVEKGESIQAYLTKYTLTDEERALILEKQSVDLTGKIELKLLDRFGGCWHVTHVEGLVGQDGNVYAQQVYYHNSCTGEDAVRTIAIVSDPDDGESTPVVSDFSGLFGGNWFSGVGSSDGPITSGNETIAGNTGTGQNPPNIQYTDPSLSTSYVDAVVTHPFIPSIDEIEREIKKLNDITNDSSKPYKSRVTELQQSLELDHERGFEFSKDIDNNITSQEKPSTETGVIFGLPNENTTVRLHDHHNGLDPIFSAEDISGMSEFYAVKNDLVGSEAADVISMMISRTGAYANTVDDPNKVFQFYNDLKTGTTKINGKFVSTMSFYKNSYKTDVIQKSQQQCGGTCTTEEYNNFLITNFLSWLQAWDTGIGYYIGISNGDGTYTWTRIN